MQAKSLKMWQVHCAHDAKHTSSKSPRAEIARILQDCLKTCKFKTWAKNLSNAAAKRRTIWSRAWSEHDRSIQTTNRKPPVRGDQKSHRRESFCMEKQALRLAPKVSPNTAPATKVTISKITNFARLPQNWQLKNQLLLFLAILTLSNSYSQLLVLSASLPSATLPSATLLSATLSLS